MKLVIYLFCALAISRAATGTEWFQWGGPHGNFHVDRAAPLELRAESPRRLWQQTLGPGMSGVVCAGDSLYTMYLQPFSKDALNLEESARIHREVIVALDAATGTVRWRHEYDAGWRKQQEAFGGRVRAPQATPAIVGDYLLTVGFTGVVTCVDRHDGTPQWQMDLVAERDATPVQFGFSASPLVMGERVVILSGGHRAGLICLDPRTGEMLWNVPCGEASYATPVLAKFAGVPQIIFMTPESIRGVEARRGEALWEYPLAEGGLTNVPTPIVDAEDGLIISGQGIKGTRKLQITRIDREWTVTELWKNRVQFFYCNWLLDGDRLLGCDGDRLLALDKRTGQTLGRWRGYADSNLLRAGSMLLVLCGNGELAVMRSQADALEFVNGFQTMEARCWTPPTWIGDRLVVRGDDQLACLDWQSEDPACPVVERTQPSKEKLVWDSDRGAAPPLDSVSKISAAFQNGGLEAALELYNQLRMTTPTSLSLEDRRELARMAESEGLADLVRLLAEHAVEQFPESRVAREWLAELTPRVDSPHPPPASHRGENGLLYIEVALRNNSVAFIETCVKGPAKHPFSYGMTFAPGKIRRETWPIGTRLYQTNDGARTKLLVELQVDDAGQTLSLFE